MPPRPKKQEHSAREGRVITSAEVGSEGLKPDSAEPASFMTTAVQGEYPEEFQEYSDAWKRAFDHTAKAGNTVKGCIQFANDHEADEVFADATQ